VAYPERRSQVARVEESSKEVNPHGASMENTRWLWVYCPLSTDARAGQHDG
jgi:hypothetical protein